MGMMGHRRLGLFLLAVVLVAAVGAVTAVPGKASTVERSGSITCTFNPREPYTAYSGEIARTACVVMHYSTTWADEPICSSGTLLLWGIGHFDTLTYFYTGRAVSPKLDGTTVSSSGIYAQDSVDLAQVLLPGARLVEASLGFGHNQPVARFLGAC
jgi:hypothetical protein